MVNMIYLIRNKKYKWEGIFFLSKKLYRSEDGSRLARVCLPLADLLFPNRPTFLMKFKIFGECKY